MTTRRMLRDAGGLCALTMAFVAVTGCHHRETAVAPPPSELAPAANERPTPTYVPPPRPTTPPARTPVTPGLSRGVSAEDLHYVATHRPILTEVGTATWYTAYKGRRSANGEVFNDSAMTAAHRTLPMGSLVEVTNLKTGQSAIMRITDRGPFVEDRMLDLTIAAARAVGIYRLGMAEVRMDVYRTPKPIDTGGRWCVQIGAFHDERAALELKAQLMHRYADANVVEFPAEHRYWVRIRPEGDDRSLAEDIARRLRPAEGEAYLTRLD